ncbi:MAG: hypothetical protein SF182_06590 [Deltaproteobacteria bacterium]|nr:hypothetical protein [Deltaproteobacteria bacterium]
MRPRARAWLIAAALLAAGGCMPTQAPPKTPLEVRAYQTRDFDTADTQQVMKAMLNVLQDDGYVVRNAVVDLGLITAAKEIDLAPGRSSSGAFGGLGGGIIIGGAGPGGVIVGSDAPPPFRKSELREFTGNVSASGTQTRVRVSVQRKVLDNRGGVVEVAPIEDAAFYQDFFARMSKGVFLQQQEL